MTKPIVLDSRMINLSVCSVYVCVCLSVHVRAHTTYHEIQLSYPRLVTHQSDLFSVQQKQQV